MQEDRPGSLFEDRDEVPPLQFAQDSDDDSGAVASLVAHDGAGDVGRVEDEFERFEDGFQSLPVDWTISSARKRGFFGLLKEITG